MATLTPNPIAPPPTQTFTPTPIGQPGQVAPITVDPNSLAQPTAATAEQQLTGILNRGGALMQSNANSGREQAAGRGLINSSMGIQAAQKAMIDSATPIATADANSLNSMATFNANVLNQNAAANAAAQNRGQEINVGAGNEFQKFDTQNKNAADQWNAAQQNEAILKTLDINSRDSLATIEANYKGLMQINSSAENMYNQVMKNINEIQLSKDVADKTTAINSQLAWLNSGMQMLQSLNGVTGLVNFA